jgi:NAD(P)-dependent dehydrogenase (short-subunit alcohol dehydrogenase family)
MNNRMSGKVAVVTGSTGGIGEGIARRLAAEGVAVVVSGRRVEVGERVAREIRDGGGRAVFVRANVASEPDCAGLIRAAVEHFCRLDVLVNNAAHFGRVPFEELSPEFWTQVFAVNVGGALFCSREAIPLMREQGGGSIVNVGTTMVYRGDSENLARLSYTCSKGALLTMTRTMARALLGDRIRVNWVAVGWVTTPGEIALRDQVYGDGMAFLQGISERAPMGRLETVEETAAGVAYLASDEASHVTGCELNISGGLWI